MTKNQKDKIIFTRLPKEAVTVVRADPHKQTAVRTVVKEIFKKYGADISELAKS